MVLLPASGNGSIVRSMEQRRARSRAACSQKAITYDDQRFASSDLHRLTRRIKGFQNMTLTHFWKCHKKRLFNLVRPQIPILKLNLKVKIVADGTKNDILPD